jgi:outer membrane receptor for ferrienterochelin and colicin
MKQNLLKYVVALLLLVVSTEQLMAQGVTTSGISGRVVDADGETLPGANVLAVHTPSGTRYGAVTNLDGRFQIPNVRVGGPYTLTVSFIGFEPSVREGITLALGQTLNLNIAMVSDAADLEEFVVSAGRGEIIDGTRTGAETSISNQQIQTMPTISRGFNDFTRMTPQADIKGDAISIGGMNNRFNQVTIDGAVSNDVFGLAASGTNGGQTGTSPISLDAIETFQVQIAPYDVTLGGFAGGGVSAVTRSGTNEFSGSVFHYFRNQNLAGLTPTDDPNQERTRFNNFSDRQTGFRIGGPIIKDKLFFFLNGEITDNTTPLGFMPGTPDSEITAAEAMRVASILRNQYGYDPGSWEDQFSTSSSEKLFVRFDYNIDDRNKLTLRHSYNKGEAVQLSRGQRVLTFSNGAILRSSPTHSSVLELSSRLSNNASNKLLIGYTNIREPRTAPGEPFPRGTINIGSARTINFGTEAFSTVNQLNQDVLTITDNLELYRGKHTITLGTHNEYYNIYNAFIGENFGTYQFANLDFFEQGRASRFSYQYSITDNPREGAEFGAMQFGVYGQDQIQVNENFSLTAGVRLDVPVYLDNPRTNSDFNNSILASQFGVQNDRLPKPAFMFSPRVGFNYNVDGKSETQLRGGTGVFTSRFPFVWMSGAFTQSGVLLNIHQIGQNNADPPTVTFNPDPFSQAPNPSGQGPGGRMTVVDRNFKLPQIWRTNFGVDQKLPWWGLIATVDLMYSKNLHTFRFTQINQIESTGNLIGSGDNRAIWPNPNNDKKILRNYDEVIYISNTNAGHAMSGTFQIQKPFENGFYGSLAYTFTNSRDLFPGTSSQNHSNWRPLPTVNGINQAEVANSPFNTGSRIVGSASYRKEYLGKFATTVSMFYNGQSGALFSYVHNGDLNREDVSGGQNNDLIYIPRNALDASEIRFLDGYSRGGQVISAAQQAQEFEDFINSQKYLRERRGQYAERNGSRHPFTHQFDVKIIQDIFTNIGGKENVLQLTFDVFNVGNLINKNWGRQYSWSSGYFDNSFQVLRLRNQANLQNEQPVFTFDPVRENSPWTISDDAIGGSRWVGQLGIRYIFN